MGRDRGGQGCHTNQDQQRDPYCLSDACSSFRPRPMVCGQNQHGLCQRSQTSRFFIVLPYIARSTPFRNCNSLYNFHIRRVKACESFFSVLCKFRKCKRFHTWVPNYPLHQITMNPGAGAAAKGFCEKSVIWPLPQPRGGAGTAFAPTPLARRIRGD